VTVCAAWLSGGCTRASLQIVDLDFLKIPEAGRLVDEIGALDCVWWLDGDNVCIAATRSGGVRGSAGRRLDLSFVLPGVPAATARDYALGPESMRGYVRQGPIHLRYRSQRGIAAVWLQPGGKLRVRFRVFAGRQSFHILTGWSTVGQTLLTGELRARSDAKFGAEILRRSEADGMNRGPVQNTPTGGRPRPVRIAGPDDSAGGA